MVLEKPACVGPISTPTRAARSYPVAMASPALWSTCSKRRRSTASVTPKSEEVCDCGHVHVRDAADCNGTL